MKSIFFALLAALLLVGCEPSGNIDNMTITAPATQFSDMGPTTRDQHEAIDTWHNLLRASLRDPRMTNTDREVVEYTLNPGLLPRERRVDRDIEQDILRGVWAEELWFTVFYMCEFPNFALQDAEWFTPDLTALCRRIMDGRFLYQNDNTWELVRRPMDDRSSGIANKCQTLYDHILNSDDQKIPLKGLTLIIIMHDLRDPDGLFWENGPCPTCQAINKSLAWGNCALQCCLGAVSSAASAAVSMSGPAGGAAMNASIWMLHGRASAEITAYVNGCYIDRCNHDTIYPAPPEQVGSEWAPHTVWDPIYGATPPLY